MTLLSSFVSISFCLLDRLSICLAVWLQPVGSSFRLLVGLSVNWSVFRWSVFPLVCLSSRLAGCQSVSWSFRLVVCLSVSLPFVCLSVCVFAFRVLTWLSSFQPTRPLVCLFCLVCVFNCLRVNQRDSLSVCLSIYLSIASVDVSCQKKIVLTFESL